MPFCISGTHRGGADKPFARVTKSANDRQCVSMEGGCKHVTDSADDNQGWVKQTTFTAATDIPRLLRN